MILFMLLIWGNILTKEQNLTNIAQKGFAWENDLLQRRMN